MKAQPEHTSAWYNLGVVQRDAGKTADAEHSYRTATKLSPTHKDATNGLATLLWSKVPNTNPQHPTYDIVVLTSRLQEVACLFSQKVVIMHVSVPQ